MNLDYHTLRCIIFRMLGGNNYSKKAQKIQSIYDKWKNDLSGLIQKRVRLIREATKQIEQKKLDQIKSEIEKQ